MAIVCEVCGDVGYRQLLVQCIKCKNAARHLYCLDRVIFDASSFEWLCDDCPPKHNEVPKSMEWNCDRSHKVPRWTGSRNVIEEHDMLCEEGFNKGGVRMHSRPKNMNDVLETRSVTRFLVPDDSEDRYSIQLGSIINEPNVNRAEVTKESLSWGCRRHRSHKARSYSTWSCRRRRSQKARRDSSDASTKHVPSANTFNSSEMPVRKKLKGNDVLEEGESTNDHLVYQPESADGSSHSASGLTIQIQKTGGAVGPTLPNMEQEDGVLENVEQPHPLEMVNPDATIHLSVGPALEMEEQGAEAGLCASVEDVEKALPILTDETSPTWLTEEQVDCCSPASESCDQPVPLKVVILRPWHDVPSSNDSQSMQGLDLYDGNIPSKEWLDSRLKLEEQGVEAGLFASHEYVEQTHPNFTDKTSPVCSSEMQVYGCSPTSESWEQPDPLEVVKPCDDAPNSILRLETPSNYAKPMQGSDLDVGNMHVLDPPEEWMDSRLMSNTVEPSRSSNEGGTSVEKDNTEKPECLSAMDTVTPGLDNVQGSNTSVEPSSSSNGEGNLAVGKHSAEMTECFQELNPSTPTRPDEVHRWRGEFNGSYYPKPALKRRISKMMYPRFWFHLRKMWLVGKHRKWKMSLPSKHVSPQKATKSSFRKQYKEPKRHIPHHTKHQKTKLVINDRNTDPTHMRGCRPSKPVDRTCSSASLDLSPKTEEVNDAEPRCSKSLRTLENVMAKKRKRPTSSYGDDDDEAMQMEVRMHRSHVKNSVMKQRKYVENSENAMSPRNSNNQHANDHMKARKQRRANKDKKAPLRNASVPCTQNDAAQLAADQQSFICTQPIDRPFWTGIMKIGQEYISLAAHLSNQACKEVQELSLSLPALMKVTKHSKLKAWPGRWKASEPTAECIGLYFFSDNMRELDQLVHYLTDNSLVLKYVIGFAKLLIFPSVFLPEQCQTFQGKHYLWGVFRRRMDTGTTGAVG